MASIVRVRSYTHQELFKIDTASFVYVEDLLFDLLTSQIAINPIAIHLFGLYNTRQNIWLSPNQKFDEEFFDFFDFVEKSVSDFDLRIRFFPNEALEVLKCDHRAFSYLFAQVQYDFKNLPETFFSGRKIEKFENEIYGIALQGVIIDVLEKKVELDYTNVAGYVEQVFEDLPTRMPISLVQKFYKNSTRKEKIKEKLFDTFTKRRNSDVLKIFYINQFVQKLECCDEFYEVRFSRIRDSLVLKKTIAYQSSSGMITLQIPKDKVSVEELFNIKKVMELTISNDEHSIMNIGNIESQPITLKFKNVFKCYAFASLLSGYYRLRHKWNFQLCENVPSPLLSHLHVWYAHGPVGSKFVRAKLEHFNDSRNCDNFFIIHQDDRKFQRFHLDSLTRKFELELRTSKKEEKSGFYFKEDNRMFFEPKDLVEYFRSKIKASILTPKDNDLPPSIMLCGDSSASSLEKNTPDLPIIHAEQLEKSKFFFQKSNVFAIHYGTIVLEKAKRTPVMVKEFDLGQSGDEFRSHLALMARWVKLKDDSLVNCLGILLDPFSMMSDKCQTSVVELYQHKSSALRSHHFAQAGYYLARALDYLNNANFVHGQIRFENLFVNKFSEHLLVIKLGDPVGMMHVYNQPRTQQAWLPPEYFNPLDSLGSKLTSFCDVWAFGTTLYQIYHDGRLPQTNSRFFIDSNVSRTIQDVISNCWQEDYKLRIQAGRIFHLMCRAVNSFNEITNQYEEIQQKQYREHNGTNGGDHSNENFNGNDEIPNESSTSTGNGSLNGNHDNNSKFSYSKVFSLSNFFSSKRANSVISINSAITETTTVCNVSIYDYHKTDEGFSFANISRDSIQLVREIGKGNFGCVFRALHNGDTDVAIKFLFQKDATNLNAEIQILTKLYHKNIVSILGFTNLLTSDMQGFESLEKCNGYGMVIEFMQHGSLKSYLQRRFNENEKGSKYQVPFVKFALDIAKGLRYLQKNHVLHRDLATRNILVSSETEVKISDFGLAHILSEHEDVYSMKNINYIPFRCWPPETFQYKYTHFSDVWSYGILVWEMYRYCQEEAFFEVDYEHLYEHLVKQNRPPKPNNCPAEIYDIMTRCWNFSPEYRPSAKTICLELKQICDISDVDTEELTHQDQSSL